MVVKWLLLVIVAGCTYCVCVGNNIRNTNVLTVPDHMDYSRMYVRVIILAQWAFPLQMGQRLVA